MNREILFRGRRVDNGKWVYGCLLHYNDGDMFICAEDYISGVLNKYEVDPDTVGEYTGVVDKNGVKIFEGDIVWEEYAEPDIDRETHTKPAVVEYDASRAQFIMREWRCAPDAMDGAGQIEGIGNAHDDPELLEGDGHE